MVIAITAISATLAAIGIILFVWGAVWLAINDQSVNFHGNPGQALAEALKQALSVAIGGGKGGRLVAQGTVLIILGIVGLCWAINVTGK
jgi:hypothetical protein